ncbi:hypothetical protein [Leptospira saintgironsiae]|uniref:Uncharacterized protein n=1 Tax=Leptospira saintgironsiae TaxID=2023183 RepID=A0A2M9Y7Y0_9LEPT|nr:hypothetical protein [Leptospira saintgironsiae]PJZ47536.1 hypothetical protein CH362_18760 [Leptospira saintgironsiae]
MNEFNKIIRYIIPVFTFAGYSFTLISISFLPDMSFMDELSFTDINLTLFASFSVGIGFVISSVHHLLFWRLPIYPKVTYRDYFIRLRTHGLVDFKAEDLKELSNEEELWRVLNIIWHRLRSDDQGLEKVNSRNDSLTDLMHGNGATLVSLIFAGIFTISYLLYYLCFNIYPWIPHCGFIAMAIALFFLALWFHCSSYQFTVTNLNRFVETTLYHSLNLYKNQVKDEKTRVKNGPTIFYYDSSNGG